MTGPRVPETENGVTGEFTCAMYDIMQRRLRNYGWMETRDIIKAGISSGHVLEVGPGPGYLGLEWLKRTNGTRLTALDISADMIAIARRNARLYRLRNRTHYVESPGARLPFDNGTFDAAFTNASLHEWKDPVAVMNEIARVLKPGGLYYISDLRRDTRAPFKWFMWLGVTPGVLRPGYLASIASAYTPAELRGIATASRLHVPAVHATPFGLTVTMLTA